MHRLYFFFLLFFISAVAQAQSLYKPGKLVLKTGEQREGLVLYRLHRKEQVVLFKSATGEEQRYTTDEVASFEVDGTPFLSRSFWHNKTRQTAFLHQLVEGPTSLYAYYRARGKNLYLLEKADSLSVIDSVHTLGYLRFYFGDCHYKVFNRYVQSVAYSNGELSQYVRAYNACMHPEVKATSRKRSMGRLRLAVELRAGQAVHYVRFAEERTYSFTQVTPHWGGRLFLSMGGHFALQLEAYQQAMNSKYQGREMPTDHTIYPSATQILTFSRRALRAEAAIRYTFLKKSAHRLEPYTFFGLSHVISDKRSSETWESQYWTKTWSGSPNFFLVNRPVSGRITDWVGFVGGIGTDFRLSRALTLSAESKFLYNWSEVEAIAVNNRTPQQLKALSGYPHFDYLRTFTGTLTVGVRYTF